MGFREREKKLLRERKKREKVGQLYEVSMEI